MRNHDYLMSRSHDYADAHRRAYSAEDDARAYRKKYLALRKLIREDYKAKGVVPTPEIAKAIGWKK